MTKAEVTSEKMELGTVLNSVAKNHSELSPV
jgi:hypothetical protein